MENKQTKPKLKWIMGLGLALCLLAVGGAIAFNKWNESASAKFDDYTQELFQEDVVQNTINLHYTLANPENYGITDYEVTLGSVSLADVEEGYAELEDMKKNLEGFRRSGLTKDQQLTYDILLDYVQTELSVKDLPLYAEVLGPISGYQSQLPVILAEYTFRRERDIEDYLTLVSGIDEMAEELIEFEREKAQAGLFMSDYAADTIISQCEEFIANPEENYMIEIFDDKVAAFEGLTDQEKQAYSDKNRAIITTEVVDGYRTLIDGLKELKGSGTNDLGLCYYEDGTRYYEYLVRSGTGTDTSVEQLMRKTEYFLEEFIYSLQTLVQENPEAYDEFLDYEFPVMEPEEILEDLREKSADYFPEPPQVNYTIKYVHPSMEEHSSPAFYLTTPVDDLQNNLIYINNRQASSAESDGAEFYAMLAHEGYPGHLYQNIYTGSSDLPLVRSLLSYSGYAEGWATYVEHSYAFHLSGMSDTLAQLFAGNSAATLALHAYIDMGIHYEGWNQEDVVDFLAGYGISDRNAAEEIFKLVVEEPANYLNYFIGYLEFLDLRRAAEKELGEDFDVKEFHGFLLETGPAPFYIIEDYMDEWMKSA
ncbi:MAG: DUF885 domain-containing protein [Lachnospiraceae bacterium]|nr:DUF885 domain-containing protein [Lachnospiraceae bacterium]